MADFCVYYADGSTFKGNPEDAPTELVICIAIPPRPLKPTDPPGTFYRWTLVQEHDLYLYLDPPEDSWRMRGWYGIDKYEDLIRHMKLADIHKGEIRAILSGVQIDKRTFDEIILRAERDFEMTRR